MSAADRTRARLRVTGTVQGVGFRPFVYGRALALGLTGFVRNDPAGVLAEVEGDPEAIAALARALAEDPPPGALVAAVTAESVPAPAVGYDGFSIRPSDPEAPHAATPVAADTATCADCLAEVDDPTNRRHRYPFTNCAHCGPRYTIVRAVPYDRAVTTMASFAMCADCRREYDDPTDRRFHAQPNACAACGPTLAWRDPGGTPLATADAALVAAVAALRAGAVVAVKGIGGYHLAVDATDSQAVARLRRRKARDDKPFAVMVADGDAAGRLVELDGAAATALASPARPIVVAPAAGPTGLAPGVAPGRDELGVLLPYSPLHHLLLAGVGRPLVLTSGNRSDEPIAHTDDDAVDRLGPLVDGLLTHDRPIHVRCDDSVARATSRGIQLLRRSRGAAPEPMALPIAAPVPILAVGAGLKSTVALARGAAVTASHHLGDLEHLDAYRAFLQAVDHLARLQGVEPEVVVHDLHPEYLSTKFARDHAAEHDRPAIGVQHHHAHVASCLVEHGRTGPVLGVAFDGLGYGPDGTLWGGEFLVADLATAERVGHLRPVPMPGGAAAIREPWRMAASWLVAAAGPGAAAARLGDDALTCAVVALAGRPGPGAPSTTSVGRLFDAVAALLGGRRCVSYEAQAATELEALARRVPRAEVARVPDGVVVEADQLDPAPLIRALLDRRAAGVPVPMLAAIFHETLGRASAEHAADLARRNGIDTVVLTGGVFQNARFADVVVENLEGHGLSVLTHRRVPPNDGGISIGQAAVAAARLE